MNVYTYDYLERNGRLGNQLWQISACAARGIARESDLSPWRISIRPDWEYRPFFSVPGRHFEPLQSGETQIDGGTDYFQELRYVEPVQHSVREWFAPSDLSKEYIAANYDWFGEGHHTAIHVRRGDYLKNPKHFPLPSLGYYMAGVYDVQQKHPNTEVLVFSDDLAWCRKHFPSEFTFVEGTARPVEVAERKGQPQDQWDLFLMTMCDAHVISNSTFSWWGAYLSNNPHPFYPSVWFGPALQWQKCPAPEGWIAC